MVARCVQRHGRLSLVAKFNPYRSLFNYCRHFSVIGYRVFNKPFVSLTISGADLSAKYENPRPFQISESAFREIRRALGYGDGFAHVLTLAIAKIPEYTGRQDQAQGRRDQGGSPSHKPSIGAAFFVTLLGLLSLLLCGFGDGYHLYKQRRFHTAIWLGLGVPCGELEGVAIFDSF